jgi:transcriptional regulator with GAF, ATPase, and Fis domain
MQITLDSYNLLAAERVLVEAALGEAGSIVGAAELLGEDRHTVKRRIIKHNIRWPRALTSTRPAAGDAPP